MKTLTLDNNGISCFIFILQKLYKRLGRGEIARKISPHAWSLFSLPALVASFICDKRGSTLLYYSFFFFHFSFLFEQSHCTLGESQRQKYETFVPPCELIEGTPTYI